MRRMCDTQNARGQETRIDEQAVSARNCGRMWAAMRTIMRGAGAAIAGGSQSECTQAHPQTSGALDDSLITHCMFVDRVLPSYSI